MNTIMGIPVRASAHDERYSYLHSQITSGGIELTLQHDAFHNADIIYLRYHRDGMCMTVAIHRATEPERAMREYLALVSPYLLHLVDEEASKHTEWPRMDTDDMHPVTETVVP